MTTHDKEPNVYPHILITARVPEMPSLAKDGDQPTVQAACGSSSTAPAGPPADKEATMNTSVTGDQDPWTEKMRRDEMRYEVCQFAHALLRRGDCPLAIVQALVDGTVAFAGRIGEEAMRKCVAEAADFDYSYQRSRQKAEKHDDKECHPY